MWQSDWTEWHLADGTSVAIAGTIDDHSRYLCALAADIGDGTTTLVWQVMLAAIDECGVPSMSLTDNGFVYTGKHRGFETPLEKNLRAVGTRTINSRPDHPQTCGKIERFWQTLKRWLNTQPAPATLDDLNEMLDRFRSHYNHHRPHRALHGATPAETFDATEPARPVDRPLPAPVFTTHQQVNPTQGKITVGPYFVQVGNQWGGTHPRRHLRRQPHRHLQRHHHRPGIRRRPHPPIPRPTPNPRHPWQTTTTSGSMTVSDDPRHKCQR
ncbi:integrase core domain-containing protein [Gordonia soli]|uniref:integrase core domain-containing protein n=1 Tax=Gordonia soli TaxID=320799 RepID=UPI001FE0A616|nr:integrase core domain-containing protein [Gordonia soli]